ncbi:MAG: VWA domain-containing protein [Cyanobacteria bacterium]|nr:VWA domain-containing protein [Cyanobacteriota bacterium]
MTQPTLSILPMHGAIAAQRSLTLDVLVKITPPEIPAQLDRPPLNLGFVLDRSGSMGGAKIDYARQAVIYGIEQLLPSDRLSLTLFDTHVHTEIPSTLAIDKHRLIDQVRRIRPGSSTALHGGWVNGGMQVGQYLNPAHLNRVIVLSDGLANVGETNPDAIAQDVHGLMQRGITTTTLGVGADYDDALLEAMARSGDGNFFHITSPEQLPNIFETELQGLATTVGHSLSLTLSPQGTVVLSDVLNDLARTPEGSLKLPNLTLGDPLYVALRLQIPALDTRTEVLQVHLQWQAPDQSAPQRLSASLHLPVVSPEQMSDFPAHPEVQEQVALLMAARARQEAITFADQGDFDAASGVLRRYGAQMAAAAPASAAIAEESAALADLSVAFETEGPSTLARKRAKAEAYHLNRSRTSRHGQGPRNQTP